MPLTTTLLSPAGRPSRPRSAGNSGATSSHSASARSPRATRFLRANLPDGRDVAPLSLVRSVASNDVGVVMSSSPSLNALSTSYKSADPARIGLGTPHEADGANVSPGAVRRL
jgi:hypothetical protein